MDDASPPGATIAAGVPAGPPPAIPTPTSGAPKVFGILSIIFGSFLLLSGLLTSIFIIVGPALGALGGVIPEDAPNREMGLELISVVGTVYTAYGIQGLILAVMSGMLLAIGIGQIRYRRWAVQASVYWGIAGLVAVVGMVVMFWLVLGPAFERVFQVAAEAEAETRAQAEALAGFGRFFSTVIGGSSGIGALIFYSPYPILLIVFFRKPKVRAAMSR